ncbi:MAG: 50S ribosomal protein L25 [Deltaproteobacteria bacterium]|nr:50S ribosomal protein L25 [Deltaproteobacteria bacterium]
MEKVKLKAITRKTTGNNPARRLRTEGRMPAILYGNKADNILLSVNAKDMQTALKNKSGSQAILDIIFDDGSKKTVMIKELQRHPVSLTYLHADFYEIDMDKTIKITIPVTTKGHSIGVENGGILQILRREIEIICLPIEIPESVELDISKLEIGDSIHIDEINLGENIEIPFDQRFTLLTIASPMAEEVVEEEEEEIDGEETADEETGEETADEEKKEDKNK